MSECLELSEDQMSTLRHMLGINTPQDKIPRPYRNYAAVNPGDLKYIELERLGAIEMMGRQGSYDYYQCTESGKLAAMRSHRDIRYSTGRRRYLRYLSFSDACPDVSFHEFLTSPHYAEIRAEV